MDKLVKEAFFIGVDIGGTNTELGFVDTTGHIFAQRSFATDVHETASSFVAQLEEVVEQECAKLSKERVCKGIGIAAPNVNYLQGTIESPANLKWGTINLVALLQQHYKLPIRIINDANAAALGEMRFGLAKEMKSFVVITLGTGLGGGIVINREILNGSNGLAGELGHMTAVVGGRQCACGRFGCLETYVSANGIRRTAIELMSSRLYDSELCGISFDSLTAKMISDAAHKQDALALEVLAFTGKVLGRKLADVAACLDPEAFILMGGVANTGDLMLKPTRKSFEGYLMPVYKGKIPILLSKMQKGHPAILGATTLVA
ncbi:MAG: ROK family protein [bacterium]